MVRGLALAWQQMTAILIKRFQHSRRDWKGLLSQILLPVLFVVFAMGLGSIKKDLQHYPELELSPELYKFGPSYSFFRSVAKEYKGALGEEHTEVDKANRGAFTPSMCGALQSNSEALLFFKKSHLNNTKGVLFNLMWFVWPIPGNTADFLCVF